MFVCVCVLTSERKWQINSVDANCVCVFMNENELRNAMSSGSSIMSLSPMPETKINHLTSILLCVSVSQPSKRFDGSDSGEFGKKTRKYETRKECRQQRMLCSSSQKYVTQFDSQSEFKANIFYFEQNIGPFLYVSLDLSHTLTEFLTEIHWEMFANICEFRRDEDKNVEGGNSPRKLRTFSNL